MTNEEFNAYCKSTRERLTRETVKRENERRETKTIQGNFTRWVISDRD